MLSSSSSSSSSVCFICGFIYGCLFLWFCENIYTTWCECLHVCFQSSLPRLIYLLSARVTGFSLSFSLSLSVYSCVCQLLKMLWWDLHLSGSNHLVCLFKSHCKCKEIYTHKYTHKQETLHMIQDLFVINLRFHV